MSELSDRPIGSIVGETVPHESAIGHVTGTALYTDDLAARDRTALHAWPVQSPFARARILSLTTQPAHDVTGVVRVLTADDVPGVNDGGVKGDEPLFPVEAMFHGQPVCWVLGETLKAARLGAAAVEVEYEPLPSLVSLGEAIAAGSYQGDPIVIGRGDAGAELARAEHVFAGEFEFGGQEHFALETQASFARLDDAGQIFVDSSTQHPSETQEIVAHVLGVPNHAVTVQCLRMGGGFGGKEMQPHGYAAIAALGAVLTGRPVSVRLLRVLDMQLTGKRHPFRAEWQVGFDPDGRFRALRVTLTSDGGWSLDLSQPVLARAMCHLDNAYYIPHAEFVGRIAKTNKTSQTAFRGFGGPQGMLVVEDIIGRCAPLLGIDPGELRRRNFYAPGQSTPYGQPVRHAERLGVVCGQLVDRAEVEGRLAVIESFNAARREPAGRERNLRRGLALTPVKFGISFTFTAYNQAGALVHVYKDGSVLVNHGGTEMGQGLHTKMRQVAATALSVELAAVRIAPTRTDKVPNTSATAASSGADLNGGAIKHACEQIRDRLARVASKSLDAHPDDVRFSRGLVYAIAHEDESIAFDDVVRDAYFERVQLWAAGFYRTDGIHWDRERQQGAPFKYFAYGAAATEVEVDEYTGDYRVLRVDIVHDVGESLSPLVDRGQIEGGFVQGMGWLTLEDLRWDESDGPGRGRVATGGASTYKLPSIFELPDELNVHVLADAAESGAVYGSKAVGEPPLMLALSVREALRAAVAAFGPEGRAVELASPATPEAVFWAIRDVRAASAGPARVAGVIAGDG